MILLKYMSYWLWWSNFECHQGVRYLTYLTNCWMDCHDFIKIPAKPITIILSCNLRLALITDYIKHGCQDSSQKEKPKCLNLPLVVGCNIGHKSVMLHGCCIGAIPINALTVMITHWRTVFSLHNFAAAHVTHTTSLSEQDEEKVWLCNINLLNHFSCFHFSCGWSLII